jgi:hypothetical protein
MDMADPNTWINFFRSYKLMPGNCEKAMAYKRDGFIA